MVCTYSKIHFMFFKMTVKRCLQFLRLLIAFLLAFFKNTAIELKDMFCCFLYAIHVRIDSKQANSDVGRF